MNTDTDTTETEKETLPDPLDAHRRAISTNSIKPSRRDPDDPVELSRAARRYWR